jgi:tetratricopeptide (TPR) repeat protein
MSGGSSTVIGANAQLSEGAVALMNNDLKRGIELTELGLMTPLAPKDRAVGLSNLCAGYAAIKQWRKGFKSCEESLDIDVANWRAWQNRAACNLGLGRLRESRDDIEHGLRLNPTAPSLKKSLDVIDQHERNKLELDACGRSMRAISTQISMRCWRRLRPTDFCRALRSHVSLNAVCSGHRLGAYCRRILLLGGQCRRRYAVIERVLWILQRESARVPGAGAGGR